MPPRGLQSETEILALRRLNRMLVGTARFARHARCEIVFVLDKQISDKFIAAKPGKDFCFSVYLPAFFLLFPIHFDANKPVSRARCQPSRRFSSQSQSLMPRASQRSGVRSGAMIGRRSASCCNRFSVIYRSLFGRGGLN
jgi:hypothetical protein